MTQTTTNLKTLLHKVAEALYHIGFETKPENVNYLRCQELWWEIERTLEKFESEEASEE